MWTLDPHNEGRTAYFFEMNPAGLHGDALLTSGWGVNINKSWNGIWDVAITRGPHCWTPEIRIPFRTLQINPKQSTWGFNVQAYDQRPQRGVTLERIRAGRGPLPTAVRGGSCAGSPGCRRGSVSR